MTHAQLVVPTSLIFGLFVFWLIASDPSPDQPGADLKVSPATAANPPSDGLAVPQPK